MNTLMLVAVLGSGIAFVLVLLLWKLLLLTAGIAAVQWAMVTGFADQPAVQAAVLAPEAEGRDLRLSSQTGSGKTVALGLAIRREVRKADGKPRAFVIAPTRELAKQVEEELSWLFEPLGA